MAFPRLGNTYVLRPPRVEAYQVGDLLSPEWVPPSIAKFATLELLPTNVIIVTEKGEPLRVKLGHWIVKLDERRLVGYTDEEFQAKYERASS